MSLLENLHGVLPSECISTAAPDGHTTISLVDATQVSEFLRTIRPSMLKSNATFTIHDGSQQVPPDHQEFGPDVIILDLSRMLGIRIESDDTVSIAVGEQWTSIYEKLGVSDLSVVGGRSGAGGIGKLAQGAACHFSQPPADLSPIT
ncbi:hypothetical protein F5Y16DRAFT_406751 [Xylariaceae sp. FL0255]|nr:hypothetical protein F5Y16DRAFT_406751 [Xylariaceae sp. FL0255]